MDLKNAAFVKMRDSVSFCKQILIEYVLKSNRRPGPPLNTIFCMVCAFLPRMHVCATCVNGTGSGRVHLPQNSIYSLILLWKFHCSHSSVTPLPRASRPQDTERRSQRLCYIQIQFTIYIPTETKAHITTCRRNDVSFQSANQSKYETEKKMSQK